MFWGLAPARHIDEGTLRRWRGVADPAALSLAAGGGTGATSSAAVAALETHAVSPAVPLQAGLLKEYARAGLIGHSHAGEQKEQQHHGHSHAGGDHGHSH